MSPIQKPILCLDAILLEMLRVFRGRPLENEICHEAIQETERYEWQGIVLLRP